MRSSSEKARYAFAWIEAERALSIARRFDRSTSRSIDRTAGRGQGCDRHRGHSDRIRLADLRGPVPSADAACVTAMHSAGSYAFGKTVTAELANFTPGATRNPHGGTHAGRIVERIGRGRRFAHGAVCTRYANSRLSDSAGVILRSGRFVPTRGFVRALASCRCPTRWTWSDALPIRSKMQRCW